MQLASKFKEKYPFITNTELIDEIISVGNFQKLPEREILIDLSQRITHFPLILNGSLKIQREDSDGKEVFLYYVDSGNTCAATLSCCLNKKLSNIRALVEKEVSVINIPIEFMEEWISKYSQWRTYIFQSFSNRFEDMLKAVDQLAFKKMDERILDYLINTANLTKSNNINLSHQEIATDLNTSREVVSRLLKQLEIEDKVQLGRGNIELL